MQKYFLPLFVIILLPFCSWANKKGDVIMIANGDHDVYIESSAEELAPLLQELGISLGGTKIVEYDHLQDIKSRFKHTKSAYGGSAANTAHILSSLGKKNGIYVVLSDEELSQGFIKELEEVGVKNYGSHIPKNVRGDVTVMTELAAFITNNGAEQPERTMIAYKGLCADFSNVKFDLSHIKDYKILYIEGYIFSPESRDVIFEAIEEAKRHNVQVLFSPSNPYFVNIYRDDFKNIIAKSDIIFTNRPEIEALYEDESIEEGIVKLSRKVNVAVVTNGKYGSTINYEYGKHKVVIDEAVEQTEVKDTTGAGDAYLAGFLYGYLNGYDMERSGKTGAIIANHIIQQISCRPSNEVMDKIRNSIKSASHTAPQGVFARNKK